MKSRDREREWAAQRETWKVIRQLRSKNSTTQFHLMISSRSVVVRRRSLKSTKGFKTNDWREKKEKKEDLRRRIQIRKFIKSRFLSTKGFQWFSISTVKWRHIGRFSTWFHTWICFVSQINFLWHTKNSNDRQSSEFTSILSVLDKLELNSTINLIMKMVHLNYRI